MDKLEVKVEYIFNSGFTIETANHFMVIDYYKGELNIPEDKDLIFFVTHHHYDHYSKNIFKYRDRAKYILSFDIDDIESKDNIFFMNIDDEVRIDDIFIKTMGSTDEGSSFYIEVDGVNIFHAGDLNWWAWEDEGEAKEIERERNFKKEIDKLDGYKIDIAFVPVDPRLGKNYYLAGKYVIDRLKAKYLFQMHFKDDYSCIDKFIDKIGKSDTKIAKIERKNQIFNIKL